MADEPTRAGFRSGNRPASLRQQTPDFLRPLQIFLLCHSYLSGALLPAYAAPLTN